MAPQRHRYTKCILFTGQRANKSNERVVCKYCSEAESPQWALQNALLCNTKKLVKSHLRRCRFFHAAQASGNDEAIVFTEDEYEGDEHQQNANKSSKRKTYLEIVGANNSDNSNTIGNSDASERVQPTTTADIKTRGPMTTYKRLKLDGAQAATALAKLTRGSPAHASTAAAVNHEALERLLLNATLANGWSFNWIDQRASVQLLHALEPNMRLPVSETLVGRILESAGEKEAEFMWNAVEKERLGCTLVLDSWQHVEKERLLGRLLITSQGDVLVWNCEHVENLDQLRSDADGSMCELLSCELADLEDKSVHVVAVVSDSSDGYAHARKTLRQSRRDLMVLPCVLHQLNAFAAELFTLVPVFYETVRIGVKIAADVRDSLSLAAKLRTPIQHPALSAPFEWETLHNLTANILANKFALVALATTATIRDDNLESPTNQAVISDQIANALRSDKTFWQPLAQLDRIVFQTTRWIGTIPHHQTRLYYVPIIYHSITSALKKQQLQLVPEIRSALLERLETRWNEWEHPLLILTVALNPAFGWPFIEKSSGVTLMRVGCWARYYYESFFGAKPQNLQNELLEYTEGDKFWCSAASVSSFATPAVHRPVSLDDSTTAGVDETEHAELLTKLSFKVVQYWKSCSTDCPELAKLALRIFAVVVTSASTDGLFDSAPAINAAGPETSERLQLAAIRVRARTKHVRSSDLTGVRNVPPFQDNPSQDAIASAAVCVETSNAAPVAQRSQEACPELDELQACWMNQKVHDRRSHSEDEDRASVNEDEAINSMYAQIHPADDKFSKYSIQTLFLTR